MSDTQEEQQGWFGGRVNWKHVAIVALCLVGLAVVTRFVIPIVRGGPDRIAAPTPAITEDLPPEGDLPPSSLSVPVRISLRTLVAEVEQVVPLEWGTDEEPIEVPDQGRTNASIALRRAPFEAEIHGNVATMSTMVGYRLEATYDLPLLPDLNLGCGTGDEPRPRLRVTVEAPIGLTPDWSLTTQTRVDTVMAASSEERDKCEVTFAGFDVTGKMEEAARSFLEDNTSKIDSIVASADIRPSFEGWWNELRNPIELDENVWLEIRPTAIRHDRIVGTGDEVEIFANLQAVPRVLLGERPPIWPNELPELGDDNVAGALDILIEAVGEYPVANERLNEELIGRTLSAAGQELEITSLEVSGIGGGRIALRVGVRGDVQGHFYLVGTPRYDEITGEVSVPDLEFTAETSSLLVQSASWALDAELDALLREQALWPVQEIVSWAADRLREGLNRELSDDARLSGEVADVEILGVAARTTGLHVRASAKADATLIVRAK